MRHTRVTVILNRPQLDPREEPDYLAEWVHGDGYTEGDDGVRLDWHHGTESYVPWTSVLRVDWERCACFECEREAPGGVTDALPRRRARGPPASQEDGAPSTR